MRHSTFIITKENTQISRKKCRKKNRKKFEHRELPIEKRTSMKLRNKNHP